MKLWHRIMAVVGAVAVIASCFAGQHKPKWEKKVSAASRKTEQKLGAAARKTSEKLNAAGHKTSKKVWTYSKKESKGFNKGVHRRLTHTHTVTGHHKKIHHRTRRRHHHHVIHHKSK